MEKINIVNLLKGCPTGTKLWSDIHGECEYSGTSDVNDRYPIEIKTRSGDGTEGSASFAADGSWLVNFSGHCLLWPSKDHKTWEDWDRYKINCIPVWERPRTHKEACRILGIPYDEDVYPWMKLRILGEAWNRADRVVEDLKKITTYAPRVHDSKVGTVAILPHSSTGVPAVFPDEETAVAFGKEFRDLYLYYV